MMVKMHSSKTYMLCYYDSRITASAYGGFFAPLTYEPTPTLSAFTAYGRLYALGTEVKVDVESDAPEDQTGFYTLAARGDEGCAVYLVNFSEESRKVSTNLEGFKVSLVDVEHRVDPTELDSKDFTLAPYQIALLEG